MTRSSASFGLLFLKQMDITPHRLGNGTPVLIQETDETGIIKLSGTDLHHPDNAGHYFYDQIVTLMERTVVSRAIQPTTTPTGPLTTLKARIVTDKPWYLWLCYGAIHGPTTPAERHEGDLKGKKADLPADIFGPWPNKPRYLEKTSSWQEGPDGKAYRRKKKLKKSNFNTNTAGQKYQDWVQQYNECVMAIDEGVGRLVQSLRETGQLENTLIVYTADQGFALGQHGL